MSGLVVIVPSRGRPQAVAELAGTFDATCAVDTRLLFTVDSGDPAITAYAAAVQDAQSQSALTVGLLPNPGAQTMVAALNSAALYVTSNHPDVTAVAFLGDDHRPRTDGWDAAYLEALDAKPGLVYGNDLFQRGNLPTQVAMSTAVVRALGHMAPPTLTHLYVDDYWLALGKSAGCITYLPDVIVEHCHPVAGKAEWDAGYARVNDRAMYDRDAAAFTAYWGEHGSRDVDAVRVALGVPA